MFKVITSYEKASALGEAGLLWFRVSDEFEWRPSVRFEGLWGSKYDNSGREHVASGMYAILLES